MIVGIHFNTHGLYKEISVWQDPSFSSLTSSGGIRLFNRIISEYLFLIFCTAVNCFVLISGYFMAKSQLRTRRLLGIWLQTFFYSLIIPLILNFLQDSNGLNWFIKGLTPICSKLYWFVTMYVGLMALSPFLIKGIQALSKHLYKLLIIIMGAINVVVIWKIPLGSIYSSGTCLLYFVFLFIVGGYIRLHDLQIGKGKYGYYLIFFSLAVLFITLVQDVAIGIKHHTGLYHMLNPYNGLPFFMSVLMFLYFKNLHISTHGIVSKTVFFISPYVFGVYLISDHPKIREWLWGLFDWPNLMNSAMMIPTMVISILLIFIVCIIIDYLRDKLFRFIHVDLLSSFLANKMESVLRKIT
jgi:hypothetical protein